MKKTERKPEKFFYWQDKITKQFHYQIDYNIGFCDVGIVKTIEQIKEIEEQLGIKAEEVKDEA